MRAGILCRCINSLACLLFMWFVFNHSLCDRSLAICRENNEDPNEPALNTIRLNYVDQDLPKNHYGREAVIKFKDQLGLGLADELIKAGKPFESITGDCVFDNLRKKYFISSLERFFKIPVNKPGRLLSKNGITENAAREYENTIRTNYLEYIKQIKNRFGQRQKRAPHQNDVPNLVNIFRIKFSQEVNLEQVCREMRQLEYVEYIVPNERCELHLVPNDPYYTSGGSWGQSYDDLYGLKSGKLNCEPAWDISLGDQIIVAVVDTGIDYNHPEFAGNIWTNTEEVPGNGVDDDHNGYIDDVMGYDFSENDANPADYMGHGTHCAGTIAAVINNSQGIVGVAPHTKIMCLKGFPNSTFNVLAEAIRYAADNGADIISNSWGPTGVYPSNPVLEAAVDYAHALGCVVVFSAGNKNDDVKKYSPANYYKTLAVAATDSSDKKASFSNYGYLIDVSAPGVEVLSLRAEGTDMYEGSTGYTPGARFVPAYDPQAEYYRANGTSMSCPHVAGLAALLVNQYPEMTNDMIAGRIIGTTDTINGSNPDYAGLLGSGRINAYSALTASEIPYVKLYEYAFSSKFNPGVTVNLLVSLINKWAPASNVQVTLNTSDPYITVLQQNSNYGSMDTNVAKKNTADPFTISINSQAPYGHTVEFEIIIHADGHQSTYSFTADISYSNLPGWPRTFDAWKYSRAPTLYDMDRDGKDEVIIGMDNLLYVLRNDGTNCPGWPQAVQAGGYICKHVAGDIDGDGDNEIVAIVNVSAGVSHTYWYAWHFENGAPVNGWPQDMGRSYNTADVALADMDNNPSDLEIIIVRGNDGYNPPKLYVLKGNGSNVSGWPVNLPVFSFNVAGLAIGNIDNQPGKEIVVATGRMPGWYYEESPVFVYRNNGTPMPGWPIMTNGYCNPPVLCNMDNNESDIEIIAGSVTETNRGKIYAWKYNGTNVPGWPVSANTYGLSAGDINHDGKAEIVARGSWPEVLRAFNRQGQLLWSKSLSPWTTASIVDIDNDDFSEIIFGTTAGYYLYVVDHNGNFESGFPIELSYFINNNQPAVGDLNGDGRLEIVAVANGDPLYVYVFSLLGLKPDFMDWPMAGRDAQNRAFYYISILLSGDFNKDGHVNLTDLQTFSSYWLAAPCDDFWGDERNWCSGTDLTRSGAVDLADFRIFSQSWLESNIQ